MGPSPLAAVNAKLFATMATLVGLSLVVLSYLWPYLSEHRGSWTEEKALRYIELGQQIHKLTFKVRGAAEPRKMHGGKSAEEDGLLANRKRLEEAWVEAKELKAELDGVQTSRDGRPALFKWIGIGLAATGVVVLLVMRGHENA